MANVWGYWDCPKCGGKHYRGDATECPNCGAPRTDDVEIYLDGNNIEHVDKKLENKKPDWTCAYCGAMNGDRLDSCERCGASRADSKGDYFTARRAREARDPENSLAGRQAVSARSDIDDLLDNMAEIFDNDSREAAAPEPIRKRGGFMRKNKNRLLIAGAASVAAALLVWLIAWLCAPVSGRMVITGFGWERCIYIEELRTYNEDGWDLPSDARLVSSETRVRSYVPVIDHYEPVIRSVSETVIVGYHDEITGYRDLGNGQFEEIIESVPDYSTVYHDEEYQEPVYRDDPVYATYYYYEIDRWADSRSVRTSGSDQEPEWGSVYLSGNEKEGRRSEKYILKGDSGGDVAEYPIDHDDWAGLRVGDEIDFTYRRADGHILSFSVVSRAAAA